MQTFLPVFPPRRNPLCSAKSSSPPGKPSRKPTSSSYQLSGPRDKKMMPLSPTVYSRGNEAEGCSCLVQWTLVSKASPGSWGAVYVSAFVVWHCTADFWTTGFDHFLIVSYSSWFPLVLWTYGMSYDNDVNVCLQVLHLFLFWLIGFTY